MPLMSGKSSKAFSHNVEAEMNAGKPQKQALAIAYSMKRRNKAKGGMMDSYAKGGEVNEKLHPEHEGMADKIAKAVMKKMAAGGLVSSGSALKEASDFEMEKEMNDADGMDNEFMPVDPEGNHDDFLSDEDHESKEIFDPMEQKKRLSRIMMSLGR